LQKPFHTGNIHVGDSNCPGCVRTRLLRIQGSAYVRSQMGQSNVTNVSFQRWIALTDVCNRVKSAPWVTVEYAVSLSDDVKHFFENLRYVDMKNGIFFIMRYYEKRLRNFHSKMYRYVNRNVFIYQ